ncbi:MAG TPA: hypothetical protein PKD59_07625 [Miltoncostaeaceae bacterium]|nr:hypothetical protein [Miltoncostaeaceae bacterium]
MVAVPAFFVLIFASVLGVFVMQSALEGDRRLVVAGFRPGETVSARLFVLLSGTILVVAVSAVVTAVSFGAASWAPLIGSLILLGLIHAAIGALAGALLDKLAATYLMLLLVMTDIGGVQTPMFHVTPPRLAVLLPGYGPSRVKYDGAFSATFHAFAELTLYLGWVVALGVAVAVVLRRVVGARG